MMCYVMLDHNDYVAYGAVYSVQYCILQHVHILQLSTVQYSTVQWILLRSKQNGQSVIFSGEIFPLDKNFVSPNKKILAGDFLSPMGTFLAVWGIFKRSLWGEKISGDRKFPRVGA